MGRFRIKIDLVREPSYPESHGALRSTSGPTLSKHRRSGRLRSKPGGPFGSGDPRPVQLRSRTRRAGRVGPQKAVPGATNSYVRVIGCDPKDYLFVGRQSQSMAKLFAIRRLSIANKIRVENLFEEGGPVYN